MPYLHSIWIVWLKNEWMIYKIFLDLYGTAKKSQLREGSLIPIKSIPILRLPTEYFVWMKTKNQKAF